MKCTILIILFGASVVGFSQSFEGLVTTKTGEPLPYVNIGLKGSSYGTTSSETGSFRLTVRKDQLQDSVRFSMIGFVPRTFRVSDLRLFGNIIILEEDVLYLSEVVVNSSKRKEKIVGTKASSNKIVTGWGTYGTGGERGLRLALGDEAWIKELSFYVARNAYDSILLRMHMRTIENELPGKEMLRENIYIPVRIKSGWVHVDLSRYNVMGKGDVALSLEWVNAWGVCQGSECLLFSMSLTKGVLYSREASEANWTRKNRKSPGMFLVLVQ